MRLSIVTNTSGMFTEERFDDETCIIIFVVVVDRAFFRFYLYICINVYNICISFSRLDVLGS